MPNEEGEKQEVRKGPPTEREAAYNLTERLKNMSTKGKKDLRALMWDRDLEELEPAQAAIIKRWIVLSKMAATDAIKFQNWLQSDDKFKKAVWRRRIARLEFHGLEVDEALAQKAKKGDPRSMTVFYQITGKYPVGGKLVDIPKDGYENLTDKELEDRIEELNEDAARMRGEFKKRKKDDSDGEIPTAPVRTP